MDCSSQLNLCRLSEKTPDNEDYEFTPEDGDTENRISSDDVPEFISTNQTYNAIAGRPFQIGCQVNKLDETQVCSGLDLAWRMHSGQVRPLITKSV